MDSEAQDLKNLCQICYSEDFKYKCPKCGTKTCSLVCVKKHKTQSQCDGVVDNTKYIKRDEFEGNDHLVHRDYNFLMNLNRTIEVSKTDVRSKNKKILSNNYRQNNNNKRFQRNPASSSGDYETITKRQVNIRVLPKGMQRSNMNKSGWDKKKNTYVWTVEWILLDPTTGSEIAKQISYRVPEGSQLVECLHDGVKEKVTDSSFHLFLKKIDTPATKPQYIPLGNQDLLADALRDQTVIEFPTILVSTEKEVHGYTVYEREADFESESSDESDSDSSSSEDSSSDEDDSDDEPEEISSKAPIVQEVVESNEPAIQGAEASEKLPTDTTEKPNDNEATNPASL